MHNDMKLWQVDGEYEKGLWRLLSVVYEGSCEQGCWDSDFCENSSKKKSCFYLEKVI